MDESDGRGHVGESLERRHAGVALDADGVIERAAAECRRVSEDHALHHQLPHGIQRQRKAIGLPRLVSILGNTATNLLKTSVYDAPLLGYR